MLFLCKHPNKIQNIGVHINSGNGMCVSCYGIPLEVVLWDSLLACGFFSKRIYLKEISVWSLLKEVLWETVCHSGPFMHLDTPTGSGHTTVGRAA